MTYFLILPQTWKTSPSRRRSRCSLPVCCLCFSRKSQERRSRRSRNYPNPVSAGDQARSLRAVARKVSPSLSQTNPSLIIPDFAQHVKTSYFSISRRQPKRTSRSGYGMLTQKSTRSSGHIWHNFEMGKARRRRLNAGRLKRSTCCSSNPASPSTAAISSALPQISRMFQRF